MNALESCKYQIDYKQSVDLINLLEKFNMNKKIFTDNANLDNFKNLIQINKNLREYLWNFIGKHFNKFTFHFYNCNNSECSKYIDNNDKLKECKKYVNDNIFIFFNNQFHFLNTMKKKYNF